MLDFNRSMTLLIADIVSRVDELRFIQVDGLLVSASANRSPRKAGLLAYVLPLKYRDGSPVERRVRGSCEYHWGMLPLRRDGREILYFVCFLLPRFLNLSLRDKLETTVHELYHISPYFNGDLRWFKGRSKMHGDIEEYERRVRRMTDAYLASGPDPGRYQFLRYDHAGAERAYGAIRSTHVPEPRPHLIKVARHPVEVGKALEPTLP